MPNIEKIRVGETEYNITDSTNIAPVEMSSTSANAYAVGDMLIYNGQLYDVISAIAVGNTLTVGTNIQASKVSAKIKEINTKLSDYAWTPVFYFGTQTTAPSYTRDGAKICKSGNMVTYTCRINVSASGNGSQLRITNNTDTLPFKPTSYAAGILKTPSGLFSVGVNTNGDYIYVTNKNGSDANSTDFVTGIYMLTITFPCD